ncbi:hypothetical protein CAEBREN_07179 [Caenorhabditis brenneri]|uniref:Uncharacterized protein n=1 Tax=Caenorhabditis brenneri TaxID=135651 RepID=G0NWE6_CAEBE|nr:hypothetical protein CAEBREN_07179 [Caenorhabditis brenneri]
MVWPANPEEKEIISKMRTSNKPEGKLNMEYFHLEPHQFKMDEKLYQINPNIVAMCIFDMYITKEEDWCYPPRLKKKNYIEDVAIGPLHDTSDSKSLDRIRTIKERAEQDMKRYKEAMNQGRVFEVNDNNKSHSARNFEHIDEVSAVMKSVLADHFIANFVWSATTFEITASRRIRVPKHIQLRVKNLIYNAKHDPSQKNFARSMESIKSILHPESFPLESITLRLHDEFTFDNYEHVLCDPMFSTAKELILSCALTIENVRILRSKNVQVTRYQLLEGSFMDYIQKWIRTGFETREGYMFRGFQESEVSRIFRELKQMEVAEIGELPETRLTRFPECFILPIAARSFSRLLQIYCLADSDHEDAFDIYVKTLINYESDEDH